jgi:hypothetical protein
MAGIEEAFEKFSDRLAREETKRYSRDEQGDLEYLRRTRSLSNKIRTITIRC